MTYTQKMKSLIGKRVAFSNKPYPFGPVFHYTGVIANVKGLNGTTCQVTFTNGTTAYATLGNKVTVL
jgi:hypothetical protein